MISVDRQFRSVSFMTENLLPFTDEETVVSEHKCLQHLHLLALHFEILGYIPRLLNGVKGLAYLRRIGDFRGDNRTLRVLLKISKLDPFRRFIEVAENKFNGLILIEGSIVLKFLIPEGICTEDVECNLRGDTLILGLFVIVIV